ncbi:hypothetical protein [Streptomyces acidiscabies]|uniref:hypothetical protein n=1 Tax=Streptomyces acidiscabies TaxID=42234 RepID=UPI0038F6009B
MMRRALSLLGLSVVLAVLPLTASASAAYPARPPAAPAAPEPSPEPGPAPAPGAGPRPSPSPGPAPAPGRPSPTPQRPSAPEPAPGEMPSACEETGVGCDKATTGFFDVPGMIVNAVTSFLGTLVEQVMKPVREFLADTLLATPDVTRHSDIKKLWTSMLGITAGIYVLFVTAGGVTVMGYETVQTRYALQQIAPRLVLGMAAAVSSLTVMGKAVSLSNALSHAIMATDMADAGQGMVERVLPFALFGVAGLKLYLLILAIVMLVLVLAVLIGYLVRVAVLALIAVAAPLMLACHAHPLTDPVARLWWRALAGCMVIQVAQSTTFVLALKLFFAPGATTLGIPKSDQLGTMLAGVTLFWVLFKIPGWTLQVVLRGTPVSNPHAPAGVRVLKHIALYQLMGRALPGVSLLARRPSSGFGRGRGGSGGRGGPRPGQGGGGGRPPAGPGPRTGPRSSRRPATSGTPATRARAASHSAPTAPAWPGGRAPATPPPTRTPRSAPPSPRPGQRTAPPSPRTPGASSPGRAWASRTPPPGTPPPRPPRGPQPVPHPAQARRTRQLSLPVNTPRIPARPSRPTQLWLPIRTPRVPTPPPPTPPSPPPPTPRGTRQLPLPIKVPRVPVRPPRPMQLRLPLEPPRGDRP